MSCLHTHAHTKISHQKAKTDDALDVSRDCLPSLPCLWFSAPNPSVPTENIKFVHFQTVLFTNLTQTGNMECLFGTIFSRQFLLVGSVYCCFSRGFVVRQKVEKKITRLIFYHSHINQHQHVLTLVLEVDEI